MSRDKITEVFKGEAMWNRTAWLKLKGDKVVFDCSDEEYGPVEFDLSLLIEAIDNHNQLRPKHVE